MFNSHKWDLFPLDTRKQEITKTRNHENKKSRKQDWFTIFAVEPINRSKETVLQYVERIYDETPFYDYTRFPTIPRQLCPKTLLTYKNFSNIVQSLKDNGVGFFYVTVDTINSNDKFKNFINRVKNRTHVKDYTSCYLFCLLSEVKCEPTIVNCDHNHIITLKNNIKVLYGNYYKYD